MLPVAKPILNHFTRCAVESGRAQSAPVFHIAAFTIVTLKHGYSPNEFEIPKAES